jgi:DNA repair exonuclease SbcCD ATPase subunit
MKINKIVVENFLSIKHAEIDFDALPNLVRVVGKNRDTKPISSNGAGKSSIIEAVVFGLFGRTMRKTNEKSVTNNLTKGKCKVTITVNDDVVIERTKKPPMLLVSSGGENLTLEGVQQTQAALETLLNTNYNVFLASIVFGQQNGVNFLEATPEEKRSIIQNFLDVGNLFKNRGAIRSLKSRYNTEKKLSTAIHDDALQKAADLDVKIKDLVAFRKESRNVFTPEILELISKHSLSEIRDLETMAHEKELEANGISFQISTITSDFNRTKKQLNHLGTANCEHCGLAPKDIHKQKKNLRLKLDSLTVELKNKRKEYEDASDLVADISIPISSSDYDTVESLKKIEVQLTTYRGTRRESKKIAKKQALISTEAQKKYDMMRFWETAFSEQGLIKFVIRKILKFFTEKANFYLAILTSGQFSIEFDETLKESIYNRGTKVFYDAMSGGEKKKVSLAVMIALNELLFLTGKDKSNIIFFDEVADSLDEAGVRGIHELILELVEQKKVFVITHNTYLNSLIDSDSTDVNVTKHRGFTNITI